MRLTKNLQAEFPKNPYVQRLLARASAMGIRLRESDVHEQWLYHPGTRTIYVWQPDLASQSLSYLVVILAHEIGHAIDFDLHPQHRTITRHLHWSEAPDFIERNAFVYAYLLLQELNIPIRLSEYAQMIEEPMATLTWEALCSGHLCVLPATSPNGKACQAS